MSLTLASVCAAGLLSHTLLIGGRSPNKILFAKSSGRVWQMDFYPMYEQRGMLERTEPVRPHGSLSTACSKVAAVCRRGQRHLHVFWP